MADSSLAPGCHGEAVSATAVQQTVTWILTPTEPLFKPRNLNQPVKLLVCDSTVKIQTPEPFQTNVKPPLRLTTLIQIVEYFRSP